jgi:hypothetical protein
MLICLSIALCDFAKATSSLQSVPQSPSTARASLLPEMFIAISELLNIEAIPFAQFGITSVTPQMIDVTCTEFYSMMMMPFEMGSRQQGSSSKQTPLLLRSGVTQWLVLACGYSDGLGERMSAILKYPNIKIYDPMTDAPFEHTDFPKSCFPAEAVPASIAIWDNALAEMKKGIAEFLNLRNQQSQSNTAGMDQFAFPTPEQAAAIQAAAFQRLQRTVAAMPPGDPYTTSVLQNLNSQLTTMQARQAKVDRQSRLAVMGGWDYDSRGNRRWVEGWMQLSAKQNPLLKYYVGCLIIGGSRWPNEQVTFLSPIGCCNSNSGASLLKLAIIRKNNKQVERSAPT